MRVVLRTILDVGGGRKVRLRKEACLEIVTSMIWLLFAHWTLVEFSG